MPPSDDYTPSDDDIRLAVKLAQDVGYIRGTVKGLDGKVDGITRKVEGLEGAVNSKISSVHQSIAGLVRREDCTAHMAAIQQEVGGALAIASQAHDAAAAKSDASGQSIPKPKPTFWEKAVERSRGLTSILVFVAMLGAGVLALAHFVGRVERSLSAADEIQKKTEAAVTKKLAEPARVVYVKVGVAPDAGLATWVEPVPRHPVKHATPPRKR